jgi:hypothetical protein
MVRLTLKELYKDLNKLKLTDQKSNSFGNKLDEFIYTGPFLQKYKVRNSGFFYELGRAGIFTQGSRPDLHLSIIDARGYAVPHVTFKPDGEYGIAFHYGFKSADSLYNAFWYTYPENYTVQGEYNEQSIKDALENVFNQVMPYIEVHRKDEQGILIKSPYPFDNQGTVGRAPDSDKKRYANYQKQRRRNVLAPLNTNVQKSKRRISQHFTVNSVLKDEFSD